MSLVDGRGVPAARVHREMGALTEHASTGTCAIAESAAAPREETPRKTWARLRRRLRPHQGSYMRPRYPREPPIRSNRPLPLATSTYGHSERASYAASTCLPMAARRRRAHGGPPGEGGGAFLSK
jgi:hypothetical protein